MLPKHIYWLVLFAVCGYALWRGRRDERIVAAACLLASIATPLVVAPWRSRFSSVEMGVLAVDLATLGLFTFVALRSFRFWPLWVAGLQLTTSMAHLMKAVDLDLLPHAYGAAARFWSYPILLILLVATLRGQRQIAREQQLQTA